MKTKQPFAALFAIALLAGAGCVSVDTDAARARTALTEGRVDETCAWAENLATNSVYSAALGRAEAGRARLLAGDFAASAGWFRQAVDAAVEKSESGPVVNLTDAGNTALAATLTDDRTRVYTLPAYELNFALLYGILAQALGGQTDDACVDARLAVYVQDALAEKLGGDLPAPAATNETASAAQSVCAGQEAALEELIAGTRNSWENPVLWWLTGVLFEARGETDFAQQSYRKAQAIRPDNAVFAADAARYAPGRPARRAPQPEKARLVVVYDVGLVPMRESLKVPVPIYTGLSIDIPVYRGERPSFAPFALDGTQGQAGVDATALAARDLKERLPGIVTRNITRATVQIAAQAVANNNGNDYVKLGVFAANAVIAAFRRADTRSWITLPAETQVAEKDDLEPGRYAFQIATAHGRTTFECVLQAGETRLLYLADCGRGPRIASCVLSPPGGKSVFENHESL